MAGLYKKGRLWYNDPMKRFLCMVLCLAALLIPAAAAELNITLPDWAEDAFVIPSGIRVIDTGAFDGSSISQLVIGPDVERIGSKAFANCKNLTDVCILSDDVVIASDAFSGSTELVIYAFESSTGHTFASRHGFDYERLFTYQEDLLAIAASHLGEKYVRGQWDCVLYVRGCYYEAFGFKLPDSCQRMEQLAGQPEVRNNHLTVTRIESISELRPCDIICWKNDEVDYCTHVGMYVGAGTVGGKKYSSGVFIENSNGAGLVRYNLIPATGTGYYTRNFMCAWRILP